MLDKKTTENIIFDCVDEIHNAITSARMGIDRRTIVMRVVHESMKTDGNDLDLGKLSVLCNFVIATMQLGYYDEIYKKMSSNEDEFTRAIEEINAIFTQSRGETI